jgi:tetratricopeptide (TPR) repeat protein
MKKKLFITLSIFFLFSNILNAKSKYFEEAVDLFNQNKLDEAKFKFEQDIVFNPKNELSYLYLSKIFNKKDDINLEEKNLNAVMLLNPKNEEAIYNLVKLKLTSSDYNKSKELYKKLKSICINFCNKNEKLKIEIENLSKQ